MFFPEESDLVRLTPEHQFKYFDCGNTDLNDFLINSSKAYLQKLLAVTYVLESPDETIAYFSLLNDKVALQDVDDEDQWKTLFRTPTGKRFNSHPAIKIGRIGVSESFKGQHIGSDILNYIKLLFITGNRTGCRYITVDAYKDSLGFYEKNGFQYLTQKGRNSQTRSMYFDLMALKHSEQFWVVSSYQSSSLW